MVDAYKIKCTSSCNVLAKQIQHPCIAGGPFQWVSCPHYLAEIIIYMGLAILARHELPLTILILCWVVSILYMSGWRAANLIYIRQARHEVKQAIMCVLALQVTNLLLAAQPTHLWYQQHFPDYPKDRKALIPYVY